MVKRVLQIGDDQQESALIRSGIEMAGYSVVALVGTRDNIASIGAAAYPDLVVLSIKSPDGFILDQIRKMLRAFPCPMVVFAKRSTDHLTREAINAGVSAYIVDGFSPERLRPIFSLAIARFDEVQGLRAKLKNTQMALSERKLVDKTKGILMQKIGVSEDQAYKRLRGMAMSGNMKLSQVAKNIISMEQDLAQ